MAEGVRDLYGLPLEEFVAERDALAKRLRASGDRDGADAVKSLRKPSPAAWTVNQLARTGALEPLLEAAERLRTAQESALGGDADDLRPATAAERSAVDDAVSQARDLKPGGRAMSSATEERVRDLLHAVARDAELARAVREGAVAGEPADTSDWGLADISPGAGKPKRAKRKAEEDAASDAERRRELREARKERTQLRRDAERAAQRCAEAADAVERARSELEAAEDAADEAQAFFDTARGAAAEAEARIADLEKG